MVRIIALLLLLRKFYIIVLQPVDESNKATVEMYRCNGWVKRNKASSGPKSILCYLLDKDSNFDLVFLVFFSDSQDIPNKSSKHELNSSRSDPVVITSCCKHGICDSPMKAWSQTSLPTLSLQFQLIFCWMPLQFPTCSCLEK